LGGTKCGFLLRAIGTDTVLPRFRHQPEPPTPQFQYKQQLNCLIYF
jgi:hypothetical protein